MPNQQALLDLFEEVAGLSDRLLTLAIHLNRATTFEAMLDLLAALPLERGAHYVSLYTLEGEGSSTDLVCVAHRGSSPTAIPTGSRYTLLEMPIMQHWADDPGRVLMIEDASQHPLIDAETLRYMQAAEMMAMAVVPLVDQENARWIGAVSCVWREPHPFTPLEQATYNRLTELASVTAANLLARRELEQTVAERTESLGDVAAEVEQQARTLDGILRATGQFFALLDRDLHILYLNAPMVTQLADLPREQFYGRSYHDLIAYTEMTQDQVTALTEAFTQVFTNGEATQLDLVTEAEAQVHHTRTIVSPIHDAMGEVVAIVAIVVNGQDVTEQRLSEQAALQTAVEREHRQLLTRLMRGAGHAFRNPLAVINTKIYLLQRTTDPERRQQHLAELAMQAQDILGLVEKLHLLARLEDSAMYPPEAVSVAALLEATPWKFEMALSERPQRLEIEQVEPSLKVQANPELLETAFLNLVDNAIRYTQPGGEITISVARQGDRAALSVRDNGPGIPPEQHEAVFDYFHWQDVPGATHGHGMGLAMAKRIARQYGGDVTLVSTPGQGTTVTMTLPIAAPPPTR